MKSSADIVREAIQQSNGETCYSPELICLNDIQSKPIQWLWPSRIALGKISVIGGHPGLGKSQISIWIASIVSTGSNWPNKEGGVAKGNVILLSAEDDPADTIKPRLEAVGAEMSNCHVLQAIKSTDQTGKTKQRGFDLSKDIEQLSIAVKSIGDVRLIVIDPITAYLGKIDSNNNAEIRGLLAPLNDLAARENVAIILLTHLNKTEKQEMIGRFIGSIGTVAAARCAYAVIQDKAKPLDRYFVPIKNNIGLDSEGFCFHVEEAPLANGISTSRIIWGDTIATAKILIKEKPTETNGAAEFLRELLADGNEVLVNEIYEQGEGAGYSKATLRRAKQRIGAKHRKVSMEEGWVWWLKDDVYNPPDPSCVDSTENALEYLKAKSG